MSSETTVIDLGTMHTRIGAAGQSAPALCFRTAELGLRAGPSAPTFMRQNTTLYATGAAVTAVRPVVQNGRVKDFRAVARSLQRARAAMPGAAAERVLLTIPAHCPFAYVSSLCEAAFDAGAAAVACAVQPRLSLLSAGLTTGVCLEIGHGLSQVACVLEEGFVPGMEKAEAVAGHAADIALRHCLARRGVFFHSDHADAYCTLIKEGFCRYRSLRLKPDEDEPPLALPDGRQLVLSEEKFAPTERLFAPADGVHRLLAAALAQCSPEARSALTQNIFSSGGMTLLLGLSQRLGEMLGQVWGLETRFAIHHKQRSAWHAAWIGGSVLAANSHFQTLFVSKEQFEEEGERIIFQHFL